MLYVTIGLATMFGVGAVVGSAAIDQAARLVFDERLATAFTTAGIIRRDFERLAGDVRSIAATGGASGAEGAEATATRILDAVGSPGEFPFFSAISVCVEDQAGAVIAHASRPGAPTGRVDCPAKTEVLESFRVLGPSWEAPGFVALGDLLVPVAQATDPGVALVAVQLTSVNRSTPFDPAAVGGPDADLPVAGEPEGRAYNLEIIDPDGITRLAFGRHEHFGGPSPHFAGIRQLMADGDASALVDPGNETLGVEPHVMAVVPLAETPFYLLLEQPIDVALALPNQLRQELLVLIVVGFAGTAAVAWFTTRRVVKPTERLTAAAERMAGGDLTEPISAAAQDEVAVLAAALETMRAQLRQALDELERSNRALEERVAERTARLGQVLRKMITAQEDERHGLARELHDDTAQSLAALSIALDGIRDELGDSSPAAQRQVRAARDIAARVLDDTRRLILGLRPSLLDDLGLGPAIAWYAETTLTAQGTSVKLDLPSTARLPSPIETSLFRVAQEAINNIAKHAQAQHADIQMKVTADRIILTVQDDGVGFVVDETLRSAPRLGSVGLAGMQERIALLGGRLDIEARAGGGTRLVVDVPLLMEGAP